MSGYGNWRCGPPLWRVCEKRLQGAVADRVLDAAQRTSVSGASGPGHSLRDPVVTMAIQQITDSAGGRLTRLVENLTVEAPTLPPRRVLEVVRDAWDFAAALAVGEEEAFRLVELAARDQLTSLVADSERVPSRRNPRTLHCDCGARVIFLHPCDDDWAASPTCGCGAEMYPATG